MSVAIRLKNDELLGHGFPVEFHLAVSEFVEEVNEVAVGLCAVDFVHVFLRQVLEPFGKFCFGDSWVPFRKALLLLIYLNFEDF